MGKKSASLLVLTLGVVGVLAGYKLYQAKMPKMLTGVAVEANSIPGLPPEVVKLNAIQAEIGKLTNEEIGKQIIEIRAKLKAENIVVRMNKNMIEGEEKEKAKDMLVRLSLLGVEQSKRGQRPHLKAQNNS